MMIFVLLPTFINSVFQLYVQAFLKKDDAVGYRVMVQTEDHALTFLQQPGNENILYAKVLLSDFQWCRQKQFKNMLSGPKIYKCICLACFSGSIWLNTL